MRVAFELRSRYIPVAAVLAACLILPACSGDGGKSPAPLRAAQDVSVQAAGQIAETKISGPTTATVEPKPRTETAGQIANPRSGDPGAEDDDSTGPRLILFGRITLPDGSPARETTVTVGSPNQADRRFSGLTNESAQTTVAADGSYRVTFPGEHQPGQLMIQVRRQGNATAYHTLVAPGSETPAEKRGKDDQARRIKRDLVLDPAVSIRGRVTDESAGPLTSATVYAFRANVQDGSPASMSFATQTTGADGTFALDDLTSGEYTLQADAVGRIPVERKVTAPATDLMISLGEGRASISGSVYNYATRAALPDTSVTVQLMKNGETGMTVFPPRQTATDHVGAFRFEGLGPGLYILGAAKGEWRPIPTEQGEPLPSHVSLEATESTSGITLLLYPGHTVTGLVRDTKTSQPLEGVNVTLNAADQRKVTTGPDGHFRMPNVFSEHGQEVYLFSEKKGFRPTTGRNENSAPPSVRLTMKDLEPFTIIDMTPTVTISGTVKTAQGVPVSGARIGAHVANDWNARNAGIETDPSGAYEIEVKPYSFVRIKAEADGYPVTYSPSVVEVEEEPVVGVDIVLKPGSVLSGRVVDHEGKPVEEASVSAATVIMVGRYGMSDSVGVTKSGPDGLFSIPNAPEHEVHLSASKKGHASSEANRVDLTSGEAKSDIELKLRKGHVIAGRVTDLEGKPLSGVGVSANPMNSWRGGDPPRTDADGRYRIEDLEEGLYRVEASSNDLGSERKENIKAGQEDVDFVLGKKPAEAPSRARVNPRGTFVGRVVDYQSGQPITDFTVSTGNGRPAQKDPGEPGRFTIANFSSNENVSFVIKAPGYLTLEPGYQVIGAMEKTFRLGPGGTVTGRVVKGSGAESEPLGNVRVQLKGVGQEYEISERAPEQVVRTDTDGRFRLEKVSPGQNWIVFRPEAPLVDVRKQAIVDHGQEADMGEIVMGGGARVVGRVVRAPGDTPVAGTRVIIMEQPGGGGRKEVRTDNRGAFEIDGLSTLGYGLSVPEFSIRASFALSNDQTKEMVLRVGATTVKGRVLQNGQGVQAGVNLSQPDGTEKSASTSSEGAFEIKGVAPGTWQITAHARNSRSSVRAEDEVTVGSEPEVEKDLILPGGRLVGRVEDKDGNPVSGASISAQPPKGTGAFDSFIPDTSRGTSEADGSFAITGVKPGTYGVSVSKDGRLAIANNVIVPNEGDSEPVVLRIGAGGGTIVSTAFSMTSGAPIKEAWLILSNEAGRFEHGQTRGDDGTLKVENVPPGTYQVQVSSFGFQVSERSIEVKEGEETRIDDVLYEAGALRWRLQAKDGTALKNVPCRLVPDDPQSIEQVREGNSMEGMWVVRGLYPGSYTATATPAGGAPFSAKINILPHELTEIITTPE